MKHMFTKNTVGKVDGSYFIFVKGDVIENFHIVKNHGVGTVLGLDVIIEPGDMEGIIIVGDENEEN